MALGTGLPTGSLFRVRMSSTEVRRTVRLDGSSVSNSSHGTSDNLAYGQQWWDANPLNGTGIANRPHLMNFRVNNGLITNLKSHQPIAW